MTDYTYRIWQNGQPPAINATNLQDMENNISANRLHRLSIGNPHQTQIGDLSDVQINAIQDFQILGYYSGNWHNHSLAEFLMFPDSSLRLDGSVGINKDPEYDFDVEGSIRIEAIQPNLILESNYSEGWAGGIIWKNNGANKFGMFYNGESENLIFYDYANSQTRLYFDKNGTIWGAGDMHLAGNLYLGDYTVHASGVIASSGLTDIWYNASEPPDHHYTWYYPSNGYVLTKIWDDDSSSWVTTHAIDVVNVDGKPAHNVALGYYLGDGVVDANNIKVSSLTGDTIQANAIDSIHIKASAITGEKISANAITGDKISSNVITADHISSNTITANEIATSSLTSEVISANAIRGEHISAHTITGEHISANSISGTHIKASSITGDHIVADTITGDHIKTSTLTAENIRAGAIRADHIGTNTIITHSANIADAVINRAHIQDGEITSAKIADIIESTVYASDEQGWRINKTGNAEFNNVKIRGTIESTSFRKKNVSALNGTFVVTNSTVLSQDLSSSATTMHVKENVFRPGNIVLLQTDITKREKIKIISNATGSEGDYEYSIQRAQDGTTAQNWYAGTAVVQWQNRIMLTADDAVFEDSPPYIDIVENPDGLDDSVSVKVRLGKLDGLSDPELNPSGWGLYSDNVFLKGKIVISAGSGLKNADDFPESLADINSQEHGDLYTTFSGTTWYRDTENAPNCSITNISGTRINLDDGSIKLRIEFKYSASTVPADRIGFHLFEWNDTYNYPIVSTYTSQYFYLGDNYRESGTSFTSYVTFPHLRSDKNYVVYITPERITNSGTIYGDSIQVHIGGKATPNFRGNIDGTPASYVIDWSKRAKSGLTSEGFIKRIIHGSSLQADTASAISGLNMTGYYLGYYDGSNWRSFISSEGDFLFSGNGHYVGYDSDWGELRVHGHILAESTIGNSSASDVESGSIRAKNGLTSEGYIKKIIQSSIITDPTPPSSGLNLTGEYMGYYDGTEFKTFIKNDGTFYFAGNNGYIFWDPSYDTISIKGSIEAQSTIGSSNVTAGDIASWAHPTDVTYINGGKIYTGSITADKIKTHSITTDRLHIGKPRNLLYNNDFRYDFNYWIVGSPSISIRYGNDQDPTLKYVEFSSNSSSQYIRSAIFPINENTPYIITFYGKVSEISTQVLYIYINYYDDQLNLIDTDNGSLFVNNPEWRKYQFLSVSTQDYYTISPTNAKYADVKFLLNGNNYSVYLADIIFSPLVSDDVLIENGGIQARQLTIGGYNLISNPRFSYDLNDWYVSGNYEIKRSDGTAPADKYIMLNGNAELRTFEIFVDENEQYYLSFQHKGLYSCTLNVSYYNDRYDFISSDSFTISPNSSWSKSEFNITTPTNTKSLVISVSKSDSDTLSLTNFVLRKTIGTTLIENGSITTDKIQAGAVNTDHIRFDDRIDDPAKADDGMMWFRKDLNQIRYRSSGTTFKVWANANNTEAVLSDPNIYKIIQGSISSMTTDLHYDSGDYHYVAWKWYTSGVTLSNNREYTGHATYTEYDFGTASGSTVAGSYIFAYGNTGSNSNPNTLYGQHIKVYATGGSENAVKSYGNYIEMKGAANEAYGLYVRGTNIPANTSIYGIYLNIPHNIYTNNWAIYSNTDAPIYLKGSAHISGSMYTASLKPHENDVYNIGSDTMRYKNIYAISGNFASGISVGDIKMANDWIITEDERYGVILQSPTGKKFRFKLEEIT